jgi:predicted HTH transcriptional regulator
MPTIEKIAAILRNGNIAGLQGLKEDQWFDAKRAPSYDLTTAAGRFELAKDVSSFANAEGGYIIIGLTTAEVSEERTEQVNGFDLMDANSFDATVIQGVLAEYLFPRVQGLQVTWLEDNAMPGRGLGIILIPTMDHDKRFVLMKRILDADSPLPQIVFGIAVRHGSNSIPLTVEQLHRMCQDGRSSIPERLARIEAKLDSCIEDRGRQVGDEAAYAEEAALRVQRVLTDE